MSEPNTSPSKASQILDEVASWIERRDREGWTAKDQDELDAWMAQSDAHTVAFIRTKNAWSRADRLGAIKGQFSRVPAADRKRWLSLMARTAAVVAVVGVVGVVIAMNRSVPSEKIYTTPVGGRSTLALADGSKIELNTDTAIRISNAGGERTVRLEKGEAFFDIKHDAAHPFVVLASNHRVTDIGTKFIVRSRGDRLLVSLVEGKAEIETAGVSGAAKSAILSAGDVATATASSLAVKKEPAGKLATALAWRHGKLTFDNTSLAEAATEFNRYNDHKLVVSDPKIAKITVVGTFRTDDVQAFAEVAEDILHLHTKTVNGETIISH